MAKGFTERLKALDVGQTTEFDICNYNTVKSTASMLGLQYGVVLKVRADREKRIVTVERTS